MYREFDKDELGGAGLPGDLGQVCEQRQTKLWRERSYADTCKDERSRLRPYQTHFLFESDTALTPSKFEGVFSGLPRESTMACQTMMNQARSIQIWSRSVKGGQLTWLAYRRSVVVRWAGGPTYSVGRYVNYFRVDHCPLLAQP